MLSIVGTYQNGNLKLDKDYTAKNPVKVIVTFLEEIESESDKGLALTDFSFSKSKIISKTLKAHWQTQLLMKEESSYKTWYRYHSED